MIITIEILIFKHLTITMTTQSPINDVTKDIGTILSELIVSCYQRVVELT